MALEYITYSSGEVARKALNSIATFCSTAEFDSLQSIALMCGLTATMYFYTVTRDHNHLIRWAIVYMMIPLTLINMKSDMQIIDKTDPTYTASVANVPYIVAVPSYLFGQLMSGLTESVEFIFAVPDDARYGRTGMMFGSRLFQLSQSATLEDTTAKGVWNDFFTNCIRGDIEINRKYAWKDIYDSPDIFSFLDSQTMSPLRGLFMPNGDYKTCQEGYPIVKGYFTSEAGSKINLLGSYLYANQASARLAFLQSSLSDTYNNYISISRNSQEIFAQNMAINAVRSSVYDMSDSASQAMNYSYTSSKMQTTSMWMSIGLQAKEFVPMIHTIFFLMFSCFSFIVVLVALIPNITLSILGNYFKTFFNLALHPFVFAVLNSIMNWSLESRSSGYADDLGGFTLSNSNALDELHTRFAAIAGYLMMSTPLIAGAMLKGGAAIFGSLNYGLAGMINSVASRTSTAVATGDLSHGNTNVNTHSFNNMNGNKHDTSGFFKQESITAQAKDGSMFTRFSDGSVQFDNTSTVSNLHYSIAEGESVTRALRNEYAETNQNLKGYQSAVSRGTSNSATSLQNWNLNQANTSQYTDRDTISTSKNLNDNVTQMQSSLDSVSNMTGFSHSESIGLMKQISAYASGGISIPAGVTWDAAVGASFTANRDNQEAWQNLSQEQKQEIWQQAQTYNNSASKVLDISNSRDATNLNSDTKSWLASWSNNFTETENAISSVNVAQQRSQALTNALSHVEQKGLNLNENLMPMFQNYVQGLYPDERAAFQIMSAKSGDLADTRRELLEEYVNSKTFIQDLIDLPNNSDLNNSHNQSRSNLSFQDWQDVIRDHSAATNRENYTFNTWEANDRFVLDSLFDRGQMNNVRNEASDVNQMVEERFKRSQPTQPSTGKIQSDVESKILEGVTGLSGEKDDWREKAEKQNGGLIR